MCLYSLTLFCHQLPILIIIIFFIFFNRVCANFLLYVFFCIVYLKLPITNVNREMLTTKLHLHKYSASKWLRKKCRNSKVLSKINKEVGCCGWGSRGFFFSFSPNPQRSFTIGWVGQQLNVGAGYSLAIYEDTNTPASVEPWERRSNRNITALLDKHTATPNRLDRLMDRRKHRRRPSLKTHMQRH